MKANADTVTYANAGIGAASHLCGMLFMSAIDTQLVTVPYQGTGPAMTDLLGGQVDFMCDQTTNTTGQIQGGEVKAYAVTSPERLREPARPADHRRGRPARLPARRLARALRARRHPARGARQAQRGAAGRGRRPDRRRALRRARHRAGHRRRRRRPEALAKLLADQIALWKPLIEPAGAKAQ